MGRNYSDLLERSLEGSRLELLHLLAHHASLLQMPLYIVGGVVRDVLLGRPVKEFDLVLEGESAAFAEFIVKKFGGRILIHSKFGTATWMINDSTLKRINVPGLSLSDFSLSFDIVSARSETYVSPGALPTVTRSHILDDLRRRDFTINAMAIRLDGEHFGKLVDVCDGETDLEQGMIRVLHSNSFIDDPTRMFRAVRYAERYGFEIEPETRSLFDDEARGVFAKLSGERIRHEFDLVFEEPNPVSILKRIKDLGLLAALRALLVDADGDRLKSIIDKPEDDLGEFVVPEILSFRQTLGWVLYLMNVPVPFIDEIGARLAFPAALTKSASAASKLNHELPTMTEWKPSEWTFHLDAFPLLAVYAVWLASAQPRMREYLVNWRNVKPYTNGDDLKILHVPSGPKYKEILNRLRAAWLDGDVKTKEDEIFLLNKLISS